MSWPQIIVATYLTIGLIAGVLKPWRDWSSVNYPSRAIRNWIFLFAVSGAGLTTLAVVLALHAGGFW